MPHFGSTRPGLWLIKCVVAPLERRLYRLTGGRVPSTGLRRGRVLLLTTTGRRTGRLHTTPVFYLEDGERLVICNVTPEFEHISPWTLNLRADSIAGVQVGRSVSTYNAREASAEEVDRYWPRLVTLWPAYQALYAGGGQRAVFVLEPTGPVAQKQARPAISGVTARDEAGQNQPEGGAAHERGPERHNAEQDA